MKKLILTFALAFATNLSLPAQEFYSNTVGFIRHQLPEGGIKIVSAQFPKNQTSVLLGNAFSNLSDNSELYVWNGTTYDKYTYYVGFGWFDGGTNVDNIVEITQGTGLWLNDGGTGSTPVQTGEPPSAESYNIEIVAGLNMISNPYPVTTNIGDLDTSELSDEDTIYVWNGTIYDKYVYYKDLGWYDGGTNVDTIVKIPAGQGFWLEAEADGTITFNKPY